MDFHKIENVTVDDVVKAHIADLSVQEKYGVRYLQFWVNQKEGTVFCLTEGPDAKTCELVHQLAHGNVACSITEVESGTYKLFMGEGHYVDHGVVKNLDGSIDLGYRTILMAIVRSMVGVDVPKDNMLICPSWAKTIISECISEFHGREVNWDNDDSLIGVFNNTADAVKCALLIGQKLKINKDEPEVIFKIGISADQPVTKEGEFFTKALLLARCLIAIAIDDQIVTSSLVKRLFNVKLSTDSEIKSIETSDEQFIWELLRVSYENLENKDFTINRLCKDMGISRPQIYRKVIALTGRAPNDFLRDLRMEKALTLIKRKVGNISQVAMEVGYNNPSYFAKCFAEKFGCTPSEV